MLRTVHLHIGATKTGTSALQSALVRNRDWLAAHGVDYPPAFSDKLAARHKITSGNGMRLAKAVNPGLRFFPGTDPIEALRATVEIAVGSKHPIVVFSSEHLMTFKLHLAMQLQAALTMRGMGLHVHFWIRNIAAHALSTYNQLVKRHRYTQPFAVFAQSAYNPRFYTAILRAIAAAGRDNVTVTSYDRHRAGLFAALCRDLGVVDTGFEEVTTTVNRSLSRGELEAMRSINRDLESNREGVILSNALIDRAPEHRAAHAITSGERDILHARFATEIENVNSFCGNAALSLLSDDVAVVDEAAAVPPDAQDEALRFLRSVQNSTAGRSPAASTVDQVQ